MYVTLFINTKQNNIYMSLWGKNAYMMYNKNKNIKNVVQTNNKCFNINSVLYIYNFLKEYII